MNVYIDICYKEHDQKLKKNSKKKHLSRIVSQVIIDEQIK